MFTGKGWAEDSCAGRQGSTAQGLLDKKRIAPYIGRLKQLLAK
jgi:hypothetical protein